MFLLTQGWRSAKAGIVVAYVLCSLAALPLLAPPAAAQGGAGNAPKEIHFEVLSIRPMNASVNAGTNTSPSPNGFESRLSLWQAIMVAYGPTNYVNWGSVEILKAPGWIGEFYDFKARVAPADLKAWQSQSKERELLRGAMRAALKERCKLAIHEKSSPGEIFELIVGKRGPQLKAAAPQPTLPSGVKLTSGGIMAQSVQNGRQVKTYYGGTMQDLAEFLCIMAGRTPVRDRTGLTGRYDFTIQQIPPTPDENHVYSYPVGHLGLQVRLATEARPTLVIDHIEKPTAN